MLLLATYARRFGMYWVSSGSYTCNWIIGQVLDDVPDGKDIKWKVDILKAALQLLGIEFRVI